MVQQLEFISRDVGTSTYSASLVDTIKLPRDNYVKALILRLRGQVDTSSTTPSLKEDNPFGLVRRIQVVANGQTTIKSGALWNFYLKNIFQFKTIGERVQTPTTASQSDKAFSGTVIITFDPYADYRGIIPTFRLSSFELKIEWGTASDLDGSGSTSIDFAYLDVHIEEIVNLGQFDDTALYVYKEVEITQSITASGKTRIDLPRGNVYADMMLKVRNNGAMSNALIDKYSVIEDGVYYHIGNYKFLISRQQDIIEYGLGGLTVPAGLTMVDFFLPERDYTKLPDTSAMSSWELEIETATSPTSPADVTILTGELILPA
jgi:hypothetical protein